jgi:hypothetical protein
MFKTFHFISIVFVIHILPSSLPLLENEIQHLRFQSSDDMNDVVKYIAAINDKVTHMEVLQQNQLNYAE